MRRGLKQGGSERPLPLVSESDASKENDGDTANRQSAGDYANVLAKVRTTLSRYEEVTATQDRRIK